MSIYEFLVQMIFFIMLKVYIKAKYGKDTEKGLVLRCAAFMMLESMYFRIFYLQYLEYKDSEAYAGVLVVFYALVIPFTAIATLLSGGSRQEKILRGIIGFVFVVVLMLVAGTKLAWR